MILIAAEAVPSEMISTWLTIAIVPVTGIVTLILQHLFSRRVNRTQENIGKASTRVSEMDVAFDGLTANINSMSGELAGLRAELKETKADNRATQQELNTTRSDLRRLETQVSDLRVERLHFIAYVATLESLIPTPPGPPPRPDWMTKDT